MSYKLNDILLSDYGIIPGQAPGSNIALTGMFDLPKRIGETYRAWQDEDEIEPFVDADEIFLSGRDLVFYGLMSGPRSLTMSRLAILKSDIALFTDLVVFSSVFGDYNVKVERIETEVFDTLTKIVVRMREPQPDLSGGVLPATGYSNYVADSIPFKSFGLYVSDVKGRGEEPGMESGEFTIYGKEGFQITGRKPKELKINGFVKAGTLETFQTNIKALWKLLTDAGTRKVNLNDYATVEGFVTEGFTIANFQKQDGLCIANIDLRLTHIKDFVTVYLTMDTGGSILTAEDGKILTF